MNVAAVKASDAVTVEMNVADVEENVAAVDALNFKAFNFFTSHSEMIIQRSLTFKILIMFFFHDS